MTERIAGHEQNEQQPLSAAKPCGPIPPGYEDADGELAIDGQSVSSLIERAGASPCFVYSSAMIEARVAELRAAMPDALAIHYALKANPFAPLLTLMSGLCDGLDVASGGELQAALSSGMDAARISFAGPGKRDAELEAAIRAGATLNLESEGEARRALDIAARCGITPRLAIRVNPDFELRGSGMRMGGGAKAFGVDQQRVPALVREIVSAGAHWRGYHIFAGSQALDTEAIIESQRNILALVRNLSDMSGMPPVHVNLGGGFGIPYFAGDEPPDIIRIGSQLEAGLAQMEPDFPGTEYAIELGRWLVGLAGVYLTRIVDRKSSHGEIFLVTDGGLHHQLAASGNFGTVVRRNYPCAIATKWNKPVEETAHIVGCLCTPMDILGRQIALPRAEPGDIVALFCAGAYGASASPAAFLGHGPAKELLI